MSDDSSPPSAENIGTGVDRNRRGAARRGRGDRAQLSRRKILDAAAQFDSKTLTLQAVADSLGVDRKAVSYHVPTRDELLALMGSEALAAQLADLVVPGGDWKEAIRVFATAMRDAMLRERSLALYVTHMTSGALMIPAERLAEVLLNAGFDDDTTGRALSLVTAVANEAARAQLLTDEFGEHPSQTEILRVLADSPEGELPQLRRILPNLHIMNADRLDFELETVIAGLDSRLTPRSRTPARRRKLPAPADPT